MKKDIHASICLEINALLGEGLIWDGRTNQLYWVDIEQSRVYEWNLSDPSPHVYSTGQQQVGTVVPASDGNLVVALEEGIYRLVRSSGELTFLTKPHEGLEGQRFNDGKCDPAGRFWAGTIHQKRLPHAALYRIDSSLKITQVLNGLTNSNGLCWSPDHNTFYHIDTPTRQICAYDYELESGAIANKRVVITVPESMGKPDGMTIDREGMLWVALWGGAAVRCWNPTNGELLQTIHVPAPNVTSCAFGGQNLDTLFITTARIRTDVEVYPQAGGLFQARPGNVGRTGDEFMLKERCEELEIYGCFSIYLPSIILQRLCG